MAGRRKAQARGPGGRFVKADPASSKKAVLAEKPRRRRINGRMVIGR